MGAPAVHDALKRALLASAAAAVIVPAAAPPNGVSYLTALGPIR
jgi:hypothetical protein